MCHSNCDTMLDMSTWLGRSITQLSMANTLFSQRESDPHTHTRTSSHNRICLRSAAAVCRCRTAPRRLHSSHKRVWSRCIESLSSGKVLTNLSAADWSGDDESPGGGNECTWEMDICLGEGRLSQANRPRNKRRLGRGRKCEWWMEAISHRFPVIITTWHQQKEGEGRGMGSGRAHSPGERNPREETVEACPSSPCTSCLQPNRPIHICHLKEPSPSDILNKSPLKPMWSPHPFI